MPEPFLRLRPLALLFAVPMLAAALASCSPASGTDAPAYLETDPGSIVFTPGVDAASLLVKNLGDESVTFNVSVTAQSEGVEWLKVQPMAGALDGSDAMLLTVTVIDSAQLVPDSYIGSITIKGAGLEPIVVDVSLDVGQPILQVEPADTIDFGTTETTRTFIVKNVGSGLLTYSFKLPAGGWLSTEALTQKEISKNQPQTIELVADRQYANWYGEGGGEIVFLSNGLQDKNSSSTATLQVLLTVDDSCEVDANCDKPGYFCHDGHCAQRKDQGQVCALPGECTSGFCEQGVCCETACPGQCNSCSQEATLGSCQPRPDGADCSDDTYCTDGDTCQEGTCVPGPERDCATEDTDCSKGICDEGLGACVSGPPEPGWCLIDETCISGGEEHPEIPCFECRPEGAVDGYLLKKDACYIGDQCYTFGESLGTCQVCNPGNPNEASPAEDGAACDDDGNPCTEDACVAAKCTHAALVDVPCDDADICTYDTVCNDDGACVGQTAVCDDGLDCTLDLCDGEGGCLFTTKEGFCLIDDVCYVTGYASPDSPCLGCNPDLDTEDWSPDNEGLLCDDGDFCTVSDQCADGFCLGQANDCQDHQTQCVDAVCSPSDQKCVTFDREDGLECDDSDPCTVTDQCVAGTCLGTPKDCEYLAQGNTCKHAWCDPESGPEPGQCVVEDKENGTPCDDQLFCVVDEICVNGSCLGTARQCPDKVCNAATCNDESDACLYAPDVTTVGQDCDDNDVCTNGTVCTALGTCASGLTVTPEACSDALNNTNPCMVGLCDPVEGCALIPAENGTACPMDHADAQCLNGICLKVKCHAGWDDCNNDAMADGCEHDVSTDPLNCGGCGDICPTVDNAEVGCSQSQCLITLCHGDMGDCDGQLETGCETDLLTELGHCGACNDPCIKADFFANADVTCTAGSCQFLGCHLGFEDLNGNCGAEKTCIDGCEACQAVADGLTEIPDDNRDTDCDGNDTINEESRGYYVDGSFPFGAGCASPGDGTRACPYKNPKDAVAAAMGQDWTDPYAVKREIYIAQGDYYGVSPLVYTTEPLQLIGGYERTDDGPWGRPETPDPTLTHLEGDGECAVSLLHQRDLYAALDGLSVVNGDVCFGKGLFAKNVVTGKISATVVSSLWLQESTATTLYANTSTEYWRVLGNTLKGSVSTSYYPPNTAPSRFVGNTVAGGFTLSGHKHELTNNAIGGSVSLNYADVVVATGNTIAGDFKGSSWGSMSNKLYGNTIDGAILGLTPSWVIVGNHVGGDVGEKGDNSISKWVLQDNVVGGKFANDCDVCTFTGNTFEGPVPISGATLFANNTLRDDLSVYGGKGTVRNNWIEGSILAPKGHLDSRADHTLIQGNLVFGKVSVGNGGRVIGNTIFSSGTTDHALLALTGEVAVANNIFFWSQGITVTRYGIKESPVPNKPAPDVVVLKNNVFIGFGESNGALLWDDNTTAISDVSILNSHSDLLACGKGGNLALDAKLAGQFMSISPSAPGFMMPTINSPFIDDGLPLPYTCEDWTLPAANDLNGTKPPCGDAPEMGCYEWCQ